VAGGALESLLLAPKKDCSLQARVRRVLQFVFGLDNYLPDDLKSELDVIKAVHNHRITPNNRWRSGVDAKVQSLTRKEAKQVLQAFLTITVEVIKRLPAGSQWKRLKHISS